MGLDLINGAKYNDLRQALEDFDNGLRTAPMARITEMGRTGADAAGRYRMAKHDQRGHATTAEGEAQGGPHGNSNHHHPGERPTGTLQASEGERS